MKKMILGNLVSVAVSVGLLVTVAGCASADRWFSDQLAGGSSQVSQEIAAGAAENLYTSLAYGADAYVVSGKSSANARAVIGRVDNEAYQAVVTLQTAVASHDSPAVAVAICLLQEKNTVLSDTLASLLHGVAPAGAVTSSPQPPCT